MKEPIFTDLDKLNELYHAVNELIGRLGVDGYVNSKQACSDRVMNALYEIDGGEYQADGEIFTTNTISI